MKKDLPIYDIKLSDDTQGVGFISLVDEPAIGVDWIKLAKVTMMAKKAPKSIMAKKAPKSIMAKKALSTLDGSGCFGCPPNGDGTRVNGEPDGRCKGDGVDKGGGSKGGGSKAAGKAAGAKTSPSEEPLSPKSILDIDINKAKADALSDITSSSGTLTTKVSGKPTGNTGEPAKIVVLKDDVRRLLKDRIPPASSIREGYYSNKTSGYLVSSSKDTFIPGASEQTRAKLKSGDFVEVRNSASDQPIFHYNTKTGEYITHSYYNESDGGFGQYGTYSNDAKRWMNKYL